MNNIDSVIKQIAAACGIEEKNVIVNDLYLQWVLQPSYETIAVCGVLILAIVLFLSSVSETSTAIALAWCRRARGESAATVARPAAE